MTQLAADVLSQHGPVDVLINNAGISLTPLVFDKIANEQFERVLGKSSKVS
jgi:NAD(P)-dependent dehydrogenase (short-subunit alcohol dehydrogenase family)